MNVTFSNYLKERYVNAFQIDEKEIYKDEVFKILTDSYASIGGLKGNGFQSPDDMVKKIPMWKMVKRDGRVVAVALYKDKNGRKRVAVGSDGSQQGKDGVASIFREDFSRAYFEISKRSLSFHAKVLGYEHLKKFAVDPSRVKQITGDDVEYPVPSNDEEVKRHPQLKDFFYQTTVGSGTKFTKILLGTTGKKIVHHD